MRLTFSIISVAVFCSIAMAQENFSLWPRRPAELEQAQRLHRGGKDAQVLKLLSPFLHKRSLAGHEARRLTGAINMRRYLSVRHPRMHIHTVRRGETLDRIAGACKSSAELIAYVNRMLNPSDLKVGQELYIVPSDLRAELRPKELEISLWDGSSFVAAYDIQCPPELQEGPNEDTSLAERTGELNGSRLPRASAFFPSANRKLYLSNGIILSSSGQPSPHGSCIRLAPKDLNELSLLLGKGARFTIVRKTITEQKIPGEPHLPQQN